VTGRQPILVVDDDEAIRRVLVEVLEDEGYPTIAAQHGAEALELLDRHPPVCLILLDMNMPVMDGMEFARAYRGKVADPAPIVVVTAAHSAARLAGEIAAAAYLPKPFTLDDVIGVIERVCA
jgi:CheY-like chemotaxis protein